MSHSSVPRIIEHSSMEPQRHKESINVVDIEISHDEDSVRAQRRKKSSSNGPLLQNRPNVQVAASSVPPSESNYRGLDSRSFWKAGDYEVCPTKFVPAQGQLEHARVHPKFLHSNATSHKWAFGAIAELLDNAVDEKCNGATFVKVDRIYNTRDNSPALLFQDDGGGMDPECMRKCMSLGYSSKKTSTTIGQYGNGFKTSTMRLGADVIVFSRTSRKGLATQSVGLLSYTFLRKSGLDDVIVPMIDFDVSDHWAEPITYGSKDDWSANLKTILEWSPFASKDDLMQQFEDIGSHGTKIIIYNLWLNDEGIYELNFDDDDEDIRLRDEANRGSLSKINKKVAELRSHISYRIRFSLRAYASILYLRKFRNFKIILRGKPVEQFSIADDLKYKKVVTYRPQVATISKEVAVETTLGFIKEAPALRICGFNVYHKNRLIRPFWKVTADGTSQGTGVVGVLEANFMEPAHDKQDFERSSLFFKLEMKLKQMLINYWRGHCHLIGLQPAATSLHRMQKGDAVQPPVELADNGQNPLPSDQPPIDFAAGTGHDSGTVRPGRINRKDVAAGSFQALESVDISESALIDQLYEENIQLFMRRDEQILKENQLKHTIEELEKELEETKRKCVLLSSHLASQRKLKSLKEQTIKF